MDVNSMKIRIPASISALPSITKKEIKKKITKDLFENLKTYIRYSREDIWRKRGDFLDQKCGVVIEASPNTIIASPSVNITIEPDGTIAITSTHDQIFRKPYLFAGAIFPQCSADPTLLWEKAYRIAEVLYDQGCIGFIGIDFITLEGRNELVPIDLNIGSTQTMASFRLFDFLMGGTFIANFGEYKIPEKSITDLQRNLKGVRRAKFDITKSSASMSLNSTPRKPRSKRRSCPGPGPDSSQLFDPTKRFYATISQLYQPHLSLIQFHTFFNLCRHRNIQFDMNRRSGTVFMLPDSLTSGSLGILSSASSHEQAVKHLSNALNFLNNHIGHIRLKKHPFGKKATLEQVRQIIQTILRSQS